MHTQNKSNIQLKRVALKGNLSEFRDALNEEIDKIKKSGQSSILLFDGRQIESHCVDFWYRFNVEYAPAIPVDTPCKLVIGKEQMDVTVINFEENSIIISAKTPLPDTLGKARLENGTTVLMERLIKCIEENAEKENSVGNRMLSNDGIVYVAKKIFEYKDLNLKHSSNTPNQNNAIISALSNDITYIWGPPGTGKTTVIGQIIDELYKHNRSVLVVSHTNTAVDGAIEKADKFYSSSHMNNSVNYPILRIGIPTRPLPDRVLLTQHVAVLGKEMYEQKVLLEKQQAELQNRINEIRLLLAKDNWLKENNLDSIRNTLRSIATHEKEIEEIKHRIEFINISIENEKVAHPEYAKYLVLSKKLKAKKSDYDAICSQIEKTKSASSVLLDKIQNAQDELEKHSKYTELQTHKLKYMSADVLEREIDKISNQIARYKKTIYDLTAQQTAAQQVLSNYEEKSSIAKFFTNKNTILHDIANLERVQKDLHDVENSLYRQQTLQQEYSQQLKILSDLQEQICAFTPSKTQEFWINEINNLNSEINVIQNAFCDLSAQKNSLFKELGNLEIQQKQMKPTFEYLRELGKNLKKEKTHLSSVEEQHEKDEIVCTELLKKEYSLCGSFFYESASEDIAILFEELSRLFELVSIEMESIDIESIHKEKKSANQQLLEVLQQINNLNQKMQKLEKQAIMNAQIVGTTLAKSYLSETLRERDFDTVILDEASMASIPALWCASYLAKNNIVIVGDFLQLPPIVMADTPMAKKWLGKDIFYHSGMQKLARDKKTCPDNFIMLNNQFRMESDIADIANMYYGTYGGLYSDDQNQLRIKERKNFYSWYSPINHSKKNVHLIDTESLHAWVTGVPNGKGHSRLNCFSSIVSVELAFKFLEKKLQELDPITAQPEKKLLY